MTIIQYKLNYFYIYRIVTGVYPPYVTYVEDGCKSPNCFKGVYADVFHELQSLLNFTYTVSVTHGFGSRLPNQSWTGLIGKYSTLEKVTQNNSIYLFDNLQ